MKLGKDFVNLDRHKEDGKLKNRIYRVGIELEGAWDNTRIPKNTTVVRDGSVKFPELTPQEVRTYSLGELASRPLEPTEVVTWMKTFYPHKVNQTCGLHVHMSFINALAYQRLMMPEYPQTILTYVARWAEKEALPLTNTLWGRLQGNSVYCRHEFTADEQVINNHKDFDRERRGNRYTVINYCYGRQPTIECRLLSMMETSEQAIRAVNEILLITNAFLAATAKRELKVVSAVKADADNRITEHLHTTI